MSDEQLPPSAAGLERVVLRAICRQTLDSKTWKDVKSELDRYQWRDPDHAVVYTAIVKARNGGAADWRSHLPAQTTRMGFPDMDWEIYLADAGDPERKIIDLVRALRAALERRD
ncbi:MAG TPA: hypothetical protein VEJ38_07610 [Candidatus Acidoferrales bacterium]|nr:hypothetical protein [Candidatus Acidoferrales bacterium]